jgi:conjugative transfer region lipoprotein (TIGR03751 family)
MHKPLILISVLGWISLVLGGCASTKDAVLPQDGPSMQTIYQQHIQEMAARDPLTLREALEERPVGDADGSVHGYTREAYDEIDVVFPRLPNPTLVMYLFPHLAGEESAPVPGYVTTFPLYERIEYALPGEVPARRQRQ